MKIKFKSGSVNPGSFSALNSKVTTVLDAIKDGEVYDTRDMYSLAKSRAFSQRGKDYAAAGYCTRMSAHDAGVKLWWGNKRTIAAMKKQFNLK